MELILAIGLGLRLARLRMDNPGWRQMPHDNWVTWSGSMSQVVLAWAVLVAGLGTLAERWRGKSPDAWGAGRVASVALASVALLKILDCVVDSLSRRFTVIPTQPVAEAIREAFTDFYSDHLPFDTALLLLSFGLARWAAPAPNAGRRPRMGRASHHRLGPDPLRCLPAAGVDRQRQGHANARRRPRMT
jgi:hypothetical protein